MMKNSTGYWHFPRQGANKAKMKMVPLLKALSFSGGDPCAFRLECSFMCEFCLFQWLSVLGGRTCTFSSFLLNSQRDALWWGISKTHCYELIETLFWSPCCPRWVEWLGREKGRRLSWIPRVYIFEMLHEFLGSPHIWDVENVSLGDSSCDG